MKLHLALSTIALACAALLPARAAELTVSGTRFLLDGKPVPYTGVSFFNAIYNPSFNASSEARVEWLKKLQTYGINVLRVWAVLLAVLAEDTVDVPR